MSFGWNHRSPLGAALALAALLATAGAAGAEAPAPPRVPTGGRTADQHADDGRHQMVLGHYQEAIVAYREAYELQANPLFLYQIAEAYRRLEIVDRALFFYDRYLNTRPDAPDREAVETIIAELARARHGAPTPPPAPAPPAPALAATAAAKEPVAAAAPGQGPRPTPVWRRWWFWAATALGAAGVAAALAASRGDGGGGPPATALGPPMRFDL